MRTQLDPQTQSYERVRRLAKLAVADLRERIATAVRSLGDTNLVRAQMAEPRIKSYFSLARKAQQQGWGFEEALSKAQDFVGFRLVCHNLQDVRRVSKLLEASLRGQGFVVGRHDHTTKPKLSGYRAIHLVFPMLIRVAQEEAAIGCEIQLRSLLQDSWAQLSRADVYAGDVQVPVSVERRMKTMSKLLARADATADKIRTAIARPRRGHCPASGQPLTDSAVAFLYQDRFGKNPPDYLVRNTLRETQGLNLRSDGLHALLEDDAFIGRLGTIYEEASGWEPDPTQIFRWVVHSLVFGKEAGAWKAASDGRSERKEIEHIARREMLSDVKSLDQMLRSLEYGQKDEDPGSNIERWAGAFGASTECGFCGTTIVDPDEFAEAAIRHFKVRGGRAELLRERLAEATRSIAVETGARNNPSICSYCAHVLDND